MNDILKIGYIRTTRERAINRIVELTNEFGIKDIEHLFDDNIANYYEPMLVRWSFDSLC